MIRRAPARPLVGLTVAAVVMVSVDLGRRVLVGNDEARFAVLAQDILAHGRWWVPRVNDTVYLNKPVLLAWLITLVSWPAGHVTQLTAVIPSALAAVATVFVVRALAGEALGAPVGTIAALVTMTTQGMMFHARVPLPDMLMTACMTASVWMLWRMRAGRPRAWVGFYGFAAAAFWAKGTPGLLPVVIAVVWWIIDRPQAGWTRLGAPAGVSLLAALVAPWWLLPMTSPSSDIGGGLMVDQVLWYAPRVSLAAFVEPLKNLAGVLFPWAVLIPVAVMCAGRALRDREADSAAVRFLAVWSGVLFGLVALSRQQRFRYYLPLLPPLAMLLAWWWAALLAGGSVRRVPWKTYGAIAVALAVAALGSILLPTRWPKTLRVTAGAPMAEIALAVAGLGLAGGALVLLARRGRMRPLFAAAWTAAAVALLVGNHAEMVRRNRTWDYPGLAARLGGAMPPDALIVAPESQDLSVAFYFDRPTIAVVDPRLPRLLAGRSHVAAIVRDEERARYGAILPGAVYATERLGRGPVSVTIAPSPAAQQR